MCNFVTDCFLRVGTVISGPVIMTRSSVPTPSIIQFNFSGWSHAVYHCQALNMDLYDISLSLCSLMYNDHTILWEYTNTQLILLLIFRCGPFWMWCIFLYFLILLYFTLVCNVGLSLYQWRHGLQRALWNTFFTFF